MRAVLVVPPVKGQDHAAAVAAAAAREEEVPPAERADAVVGSATSLVEILTSRWRWLH